MRTFAGTVVSLIGLSLIVQQVQSNDSGENDGSVEISDPFDELPMKQRTTAKGLRESFKQIDELLREKTDSFDFDVNIKAANEMLQSQSGRLSSFFSSNAKNKEALKLFVSLPRAAELCNFEGYEILAMNSIANQGKISESITKTALDYYAKVHASNCLFDYAENLETTMMEDRLQETINSVNDILFGLNVTDVLMQSGSFKRDNQERPKTELITTSIGSFKIQDSGLVKVLRSVEVQIKDNSELEEAFYAIMEIVDKEKKFYPPKNFDVKILNAYLMRPCKDYVDTFRDFFAPARLDMFTHPVGQSLLPSKKDDKVDVLILDTWAKYRICLYLGRADLKLLQPRFERAILFKIGTKPAPYWGI